MNQKDEALIQMLWRHIEAAEAAGMSNDGTGTWRVMREAADRLEVLADVVPGMALGLVGKKSPYLRRVEAHMMDSGIQTAWVSYPTNGCIAYLTDTEQSYPVMWLMAPEEDVDAVQGTGVSCCAEAAARLAASCAVWIYRAKVAVIGRGHAVQKIGPELKKYKLEVLPTIGRDTKNAAEIVRAADIVINSAPTLEAAVEKETIGKCVLDISGALEQQRELFGDYVSRAVIGAGSNDVLAERMTGRAAMVLRERWGSND